MTGWWIRGVYKFDSMDIYSNVECKEIVKPVLYKKDSKEDEDFEIDTPFTGLELTLGLSGSYATDDVDDNNDTNNYSYD